MSTKRQRGEGSSSRPSKSMSYDKKKFISAEAFDRYNTLANKTIIPERGLRPDETRDGEVAVMIAEREWFTFTEQPEPAVIPVVKEFYANAKDHEGYKVKVRGRTVSFASEVINQYYNLPTVDNDDYADYVEAGPNYDLIVQELCQPGTRWKVKEKAAMQFPQASLSRYGKAWYAFICAKLMPSTHVSDVTKARAILLYCLVKDMDIDVGKAINRSILRPLQKGTRGGLPHPSLICGLCQQAGVKWGHDEPILHSMPPLDHSLIIRYKVWDGGESNPRGLGFIIQQPQLQADEENMTTDHTEATPSTSGMTLAQRFDRRFMRLQQRINIQHDQLVRQNHRIAKRQDAMYSYHTSFNTALAEMFAKLNTTAEPVQFPQAPSLPMYPPSDDDIEEDDDSNAE